MLDRVHEYEQGQLSLGKLVDDLRGLYVEADPHVARILEEFESKWVQIDHQNELRTESWASSGEVSDTRLAQHVRAFHDWVEGMLTGDHRTDHR